MGVIIAEVCLGSKGKGESKLLGSEAREGFIEKETLEWGSKETQDMPSTKTLKWEKPGTFRNHTGDQMV